MPSGRRREDYDPRLVAVCRSCFISSADRIPAALRDVFICVGGWAPTLHQEGGLLEQGEGHIGSIDLDWIFDLEGLRQALNGEQPDLARYVADMSLPDPKGRAKFTRLVSRDGVAGVLATDFLVAAGASESSDSVLVGNLRAFKPPGSDVALQGTSLLKLQGRSFEKNEIELSVRVASPAAIFAMKMYSMEDSLRRTGQDAGKEGRLKDSYDANFIIRAYPGGPKALAQGLKNAQPENTAQGAIRLLRKNFETRASPGWNLLKGFEASSPRKEEIVNQSFVRFRALIDELH